jgi:hypothetical protein
MLQTSLNRAFVYVYTHYTLIETAHFDLTIPNQPEENLFRLSVTLQVL